MTAIARDQATFENFWRNVIEASAFTAGHLEKAFVGFELISLVLPKLAPMTVASVITPGFLRIFIQSLANKKHNLHNAAIKTADAISLMIHKSTDSDFQLAVAECLINS